MGSAPPYAAGRVDVVRLPRGETMRDELAVEEPLEIRVNGEAVAVTMRTPGHDEELALGFLISEGASPRRAAAPPDLAANTVEVEVPGFDHEAVRRNFYTTSSCGVCGKASLDAVRLKTRYSPADDQVRVPYDVLAGLPDALRARQQVFDRTGGLHAAGLFTAIGELLVVREDVGRHNAVDKVIGWALLGGLIPARGHVLIVSGRTSFELAQKAVMAGIPVLGAVSAPSSLAVDLAAESGLTLAGFIRNGSMNVYTRPDRINVATARSAG
jgi:FdhD protein